MLRLRDYQFKAINRILMNKFKRILVVAPPGSGKTVIFTHLSKFEYLSGKKILHLSHRRELVNHCYDHLISIDVPKSDIGVILGDDKRENLDAPIQVASINTLLNRDYPEADIVIFDEAHHIISNTWLEIMSHYWKSKIYGFSASPYRLDGYGLGDVFSDLFQVVQPSYLIEHGYMAKPIIYTPGIDWLPDLSKIKLTHGDYDLPQLDVEMRKGLLIGNIVKHWQKYASGRKTLSYTCSIDHSWDIVDRFNDQGITAAHIDGSMSNIERDMIIDEMINGDTMVLSSCMLLSEGFDFPECDAIILARPTKSLSLAVQQSGRVLRPNNGVRPIILDHAGHYFQFGLPYADREFSLYDSTPKKIGESKVKTCPLCNAVVFLSCRECDCGHEFSELSLIVPLEEIGDLEKLNEDKFNEFRRRLLKVSKSSGFSDKWIKKVSELWVDYQV